MNSRGSETSVEERKIIARLYKQNKSYSEIGKVIGRSRFTVRSVVKRVHSTHKLENKPRCGRPRKLTPREERTVVCSVKKNPKLASAEIAAMLKDNLNKVVHPKTVRSRFIVRL